MRLARRHGTTLLALGLLVGLVAAFAHTERLKLERPPVGGTRFDRWLSPTCDCPGKTARLSFVLREAERIDVVVVAGDERVRVLASGLARPTGRVAFRWDGRDESGRVAPDGPYRLRVRLRDERRTIVIPTTVNVDTKPPRVLLRSVEPTFLTPGAELVLRYRAREPGTPVVLVDGELAGRGELQRAGARTLTWQELGDGMPLAPGTHSVALAVEDRAGNVSEPTEPVTIVVAER
ncbi:MAG TPA: FlgD immunoglobulin-like domain containing protein [Gaiellaceae bacterium]|nr:FlgD immunoglobulin-like domain containing protein [Gaiellaceae bacterium]